MNRSHTYSLVLSGVLIFTLAAQSLFLAPHLQASVLTSMPRLQVDIFGIVFYLLGAFLIASILLNYSRSAYAWVFLYCAVGLGGMFIVFQQKGLVAESALLMGLILAFLLSNWIKTERDWLVEAVQWINLYVAAGLLLRPELFLAAPTYRLILPETIRYSFVVVMLISAVISMLLTAQPALGKAKQGQFLALPWLIWGLILCVPLRLPNVIVSLGVAAALLLKNLIPWEKLILQDAIKIGRRFLRLVFITQSISLTLLLWMIRLVETNHTLPISQIIQVREVTFIGFSILLTVAVLVIATVNMSINGILAGLNGDRSVASQIPHARWWDRLKTAWLEPFAMAQGLLIGQINQQMEVEKLLARQANTERRRMAQLNLLHQINLELETLLDPPASAQLAANAVSSALGGDLTAILQYDPEHDEMVTLATSGPQASLVPQEYRQILKRGLIGRAARLRRTQLVPDTRLDPDHFQMENQHSLSELVVPLMYHGQLRGVIVLDHPEADSFDESDVRTIETIAAQIAISWERSDHERRLTNLVSAGITLSTTLDLETVLKEIAEIAQKTLDARFVFVALSDKGGGGYTRTTHVGYAPALLEMLSSDPERNSLIQTALNNASSIRLRDMRKRFSNTTPNEKELNSLLATPLHLRQSSIGAILAFGKQGDLPFSDSDESLATMLATQAAAAIEATWLYQELRSTLATATQLYQLSMKIIEAEQLSSAAASIAEAAHQLSNARMAGIILLTPEKEIEARIQVDASGTQPGVQHPMDLVEQVMEDGKSIMVPGPDESTRVCLPLKTPRRRYGALWVDAPETSWHNPRFADDLNTLSNQAAISLERSILLAETRKQAAQLESAYRKLELTYDQTLAALSSALDARDRETEGHSLRVSHVACALGRRLGMNDEQAKVMERGALLHDIGKIGVSDAVLLKPGKLNDEEWEFMRQHPDIGSHIIEGIPFLQEAMPVIRFHHERWDGSGYPMGLKENAIPLMARIFGVVDVFDALTSNRPYRTPMTMDEAVAYLETQAGSAFDPFIVTEFSKMARDGTLANLT